MAQFKRQFESFPANYYVAENEPGAIVRNQQVPANYIDAQRFYSTQPSQVINRRDRNIDPNMEQYDGYSEVFYEDPDAQAQVIYSTHQPMDYPSERQNVGPRNYVSVSPNAYRTNVKPVTVSKSPSPYVLQDNIPYFQQRERQDVSEAARTSKYQL
jgi:type II secretory pathway component GspD/PulD (secretin)